MSDETLRLLTSSDALDGYLAGLIGLALLGLWAVLRRRPVPGAGLFIAVAALLALRWTQRIPIELLVGLVLLALAGSFPVKSLITAMLLAIPGGVALGAAFGSSPHAELVMYVIVAVAVLAPLTAWYDHGDHESATGGALLALSIIGAFLTVPDTELVVVVTAAATPFLIIGPPLKLARLGRSGAQVGAGLLVWSVAVGGEARTSALFAGTAALGLLIIVPVLRAAGRKPVIGGIPALATQAALCLTLGLIAGLGTGLVAVASLTALVLVAGVAVAPQLTNR